MIPKKIHYCWFGGSLLPKELQDYVDGWKILYPECEFFCWNERTFDVCNSIQFVKEAYAERKYAFVADYVRMWAIYEYGGIYMDTDVRLLKRFDEYLHHRFFTAMEYHDDNVRILNIDKKLTRDGYKKKSTDVIYDICIESSFFAAEKEHPLIKDCMSYYEGKHFIMPSGDYNDKIILPVVMALEAEKYGFRYVNEFQNLNEDIYLLTDEYFTHPSKHTSNTIALHMVKNSWRSYSFCQRIYSFLAKNEIIKYAYDLVGRVPFVRRCFDYIQKNIWLRERT